jgi:hypothetical protein
MMILRLLISAAISAHHCFMSFARHPSDVPPRRLQSARREVLFVHVFLRMTCYPDLESSGDGLSQELAGLHRASDPPAGG